MAHTPKAVRKLQKLKLQVAKRVLSKFKYLTPENAIALYAYAQEKELEHSANRKKLRQEIARLKTNALQLESLVKAERAPETKRIVEV
jgi:hypothetical protein